MEDANQDKPRIIYRTSTTITTSDNTYTPIVYGNTIINLSQLKADVNTVIEVYMKDNQTGYVYTLPYITGNSSGQFSMNAYFGLYYDVVNGVNLQRVSITVSKRSGSLSDTYTFYIVVYSTQVTNTAIQS